MLKQNGYAQYQNAKIMTASPAELTLMLYEGAIKFGNIAILAMENKDPAKAHENVVKVEKIIQNFRETLDKKYPVWKDFENVYVYLLRRCQVISRTHRLWLKLPEGRTIVLGILFLKPQLCGVQVLNNQAAKGKMHDRRLFADYGRKPSKEK